MSGVAAAIISGTLGAASAGASAGATSKLNRKTREFNRQEAITARNWEERMSNTAFQRSMRDMKKAGLNPLMIYGGQGGMASTPGGATAQAGNQEVPDVGEVFSKGNASAMAALRMKKELDLVEAQKENWDEQSLTQKKMREEMEARRLNTAAQTERLVESMANFKKEQQLNSKRLDYDIKAQPFDDTLLRLKDTADTVGSVVNPFKGLFQFGGNKDYKDWKRYRYGN